jgi:hypothetical protein
MTLNLVRNNLFVVFHLISDGPTTRPPSVIIDQDVNERIVALIYMGECDSYSRQLEDRLDVFEESLFHIEASSKTRTFSRHHHFSMHTIAYP